MEICSELSFKRGAHYAVGVVMWKRKKHLVSGCLLAG